MDFEDLYDVGGPDDQGAMAGGQYDLDDLFLFSGMD